MISKLKIHIFNKNSLIYAALIFLLLFQAINNYFWIKKDCDSGGCDVYNHSYIALLLKQHFKEIVKNNRPLNENLRNLYRSLDQGALGWPRLLHAMAAVLSFGSDDELFCFRYSNIFFLSLLLISAFFIAKKICSPEAGLITATLLSFYPIIFGMSRKFGLDFPATSFILFIILLFLGDPFRSKRSSILLGISIGMCLLIKAQCVLFLGGPLIYAIVVAHRDRSNKPYLKNVIVTVFTALLISLIWWHRLISHEGIRELRFYFLSGGVSHYKDFSLLNSFRYFALSIYKNMSPVFFLVFLVGLTASIWKINMNQNGMLFLSFMPAYFIYSFLLPHTSLFSTRYLLPAYGPFAVVSVAGIMNISKRISFQVVVKILMSIAIVLGMIQFFYISYFGRVYPSQWFHSWKTNNYKMEIEKINTVIKGYDLPRNRIAIVENPGFAGDPVKLLTLYLMMADDKNEVFLSCEGEIPSVTREKFLFEAADADFVIVTSKNSNGMDFSGLKAFSEPGQKDMVMRVLTRYRAYKPVFQTRLLPEDQTLLLLTKH